MRAAIAARRKQEIDRGLTLVGPHRDELRLRLNGLDARTHASQGEQRSLALALRLAGHHVTAALTGATPVLRSASLDELAGWTQPGVVAARCQA